MVKVPLVDLSTLPGSFSYDISQPTYFTEWLSWWYLAQMKACAAANFRVQQITDGEYNALETSFNTWYTTLTTWYDNAVAARDAGDPIPAFPTLPALPVSGAASDMLISMLLKLFINSVLTKVRKDFDSDTQANSIADQLAEFRKLFEIVPDGGENILRRALLTAEDDSLIEALAAVGLHLSVEPQGIWATYNDEE